MPARDMYHYVVKTALEKDGWTITNDPLVVQVGQKRSLYIDLGAENLLAAEKTGQKIAVEIKSFIGKSFTGEFYTALGQFITYQGVLMEKEPDRVLFLAIPNITYKSQFDSKFVEMAIKNIKLRYMVYDIHKESVLLWRN